MSKGSPSIYVTSHALNGSDGASIMTQLTLSMSIDRLPLDECQLVRAGSIDSIVRYKSRSALTDCFFKYGCNLIEKLKKSILIWSGNCS